MTKHQARIVAALAEQDLNVSRTATATYYHRNTLVYHISMIQRETGLDPRRFYDMCKLLPIALETLNEA